MEQAQQSVVRNDLDLDVLRTLPPLEQAIVIAGSETELGRLAGVSQPRINQAKKRGRCSAELAVAIDAGLASHEPRVTKSELRPDLWPPEKQPNPKQQPALEGAH